MLDTLIGSFEQDFGPLNGARAIARAWVDADFALVSSATVPPRSRSSASEGSRRRI
jgi:hypothetical protein